MSRGPVKNVTAANSSIGLLAQYSVHSGEHRGTIRWILGVKLEPKPPTPGLLKKLG